MKKRKGISLLEILVITAMLAILLAIFMPATGKVKPIAQRVVCGTNLKGLGNAQVVYANDFDGQYACQGGGAGHSWSDSTDDWMEKENDWTIPGNITVSASLYLLVRMADVSPKSFVCPVSDQEEFSGNNPANLDIVELWDFGQPTANLVRGIKAEGPAQCVSYSYHQPYNPADPNTGQACRYRADDQRSAAFALMADKNPWYDSKLVSVTSNPTPTDFKKKYVSLLTNYWDGKEDFRKIKASNSLPHEREGQNVLFADGHSSFEKTSDVGVRNDNIYTRQDTSKAKDDPARWRIGTPIPNPDRRGEDETPASIEDSLLVNDFVNTVR